jgi:uncharacterized protein YxeA
MKKIIIIKLVIVLLFFGGFVYAQDRNNDKYKSYIDKENHYGISYPNSWYLKKRLSKYGKEKGKTIVYFENIKEKVILAITSSEEEPAENGTSLFISSHKDTSAKDIEEKIKGYNIGEMAIKQRLSDVKEIIVDNSNIKVWYPKGGRSCMVDFIYMGRYYSLQFNSGSEEQFAKDYPVFEKILQSFKYIN